MLYKPIFCKAQLKRIKASGANFNICLDARERQRHKPHNQGAALHAFFHSLLQVQQTCLPSTTAMQELTITHNQQHGRFEAPVEGHTAYASYRLQNNTLIFTHTFVPQALGGRGIGSALVKHVLNYAAQQGYRVDPQCSFVKIYIERHPAYQAISLAHARNC